MEYEINYIEWLDSESSHGWVMKKELTCQMSPINTIGYVLKENDSVIVISASVSEHCVDSPMTIPKFAITKRITINQEILNERQQDEGQS